MPNRVLKSRPQPYTLLRRWDQTKTRLALDRSFDKIGVPLPEWFQRERNAATVLKILQ